MDSSGKVLSEYKLLLLYLRGVLNHLVQTSRHTPTRERSYLRVVWKFLCPQLHVTCLLHFLVFSLGTPIGEWPSLPILIILPV